MIDYLIREFNEDDIDDIISLYLDTVTNVNIKDYSFQEIQAWINQENISKEDFLSKFKSSKCFIAFNDSHLLGFINIFDDGYLDCLYVNKDYINKGIGTRLVFHAINYLKEHSITKLIYSFGSITSKNFFLKLGFVLKRENIVIKNKISLKNYLFEKEI